MEKSKKLSKSIEKLNCALLEKSNYVQSACMGFDTNFRIIFKNFCKMRSNLRIQVFF